MIVECLASALVIRSLPQSVGGTDLGKRMMQGQTAAVYGTSLDGLWLYVDAPSARGWVNKGFTKETTSIIPSAHWPRVPNGRVEIEALLGPPGKPICQAGRVKLPKELKLSWENGTIVVFACHKLLEDVFTSVFKQLNDKGLWSLLEDYGGCYADRSIRGATNVSTHAWGAAIDLNTKTNALGAKPQMDKRVISVFSDHGFKWGGEFHRPDGMHFQYATGY